MGSHTCAAAPSSPSGIIYLPAVAHGDPAKPAMQAGRRYSASSEHQPSAIRTQALPSPLRQPVMQAGESRLHVLGSCQIDAGRMGRRHLMVGGAMRKSGKAMWACPGQARGPRRE